MRLSTLAIAGLTAATVATVAALVAPGQPAQPLQAEEPPARYVEGCAPGPALVCDAVEVAAAGRGPGRYRRVEVPSQTCTADKVTDAGTETVWREVVPTKPGARLEILAASCVPASTATGPRLLDGGVAFLSPACACRRATGTCQYRNDAGTLVTAPLGRTLGPGYPPFEVWSGAGCQPKACVELAGETSWPSACPGR